MLYSFGDYVIDSERHELRHGAAPVPLEPKAYQVLLYLVQQRHRLVTKEDILEHVWPGVYVDDSAVARRILEVRKALGDSPEAQRVIQTRRGQGYRFVAPMVEHTASLPTPATAVQQPAPTPVAVSPPAAVPVSAGGERKLVSVLCGVLTLPPTLPDDLDSLHDVMAAVEALVRRVMLAYGGTVQYLASNRLEVVFGAPLAQEDHAQRAVLAALALRQQWFALASASGVPAIGLSLGLHTGLVIVEAHQDDPAMPLKVLGEVALLASHLAQQASPRTILASAAVARLTHAVARLEAIPSPAVPSAAATLYRVLELRESHTPRTAYGEHVRSRFVGRHIEMDVVQTALARVLAGQGQVVGIMGEPGLGKSRLLYEFRHAVAEQPLTYLASACQAHSTLTPYLPLREILRQQCHLAAGVDLAEQTVHVYDRLQQVGLASEEWAPYILHLLDLPTATHSLPELSPQALRLRIFTALHQMFLQSSGQQPLVLEIDNLHWLDATSEAYLHALVERCVDARVLLLGTYRPGYTPPWLMHPAATQLALAPLSPSDSRQIVQDVLRRQRHPAPIQPILRRAAGNPFFLEELAQAVVEQDENTATLPMPETVQAVLAARLDQLPSGAKRVLQIAAVIGPEVPRALLQPLVNLADEELDRQLERLQKAAFLYETGLAPEPVYTFKHVLTQEVAYQSLLRRTRQQRHAQIARLLQERCPHLAETQPEILAYHHTQAGHHEEAIASWWQAGQRAAARLAHVEARSHFTRGLSLLSSFPDTPARRQHELMLQIALGRVLTITRGYAAAEVERAFSRARQLCEQGQDIAQDSWALRGLWSFYLARAQYKTARELGEQFLSQAQGSHDPADLIAAHEALGTTLYFLGAFVQARAHLEQGCALYTPHVNQAYAAVHLADPGVHCHAYAARVLWMLGYPDQALARVQQALTLARELGQPYSLAEALYFAMHIHQYRGESHQVHQYAETLIPLATEQAFPYWLALGRLLGGWALAAQGHSATGIAHMRQGLAEVRAIGTEVGQPYFLTLLAEVLGQVGQYDEGLQLLATACTLADHSGEQHYAAEQYRLRSVLLLAQADLGSQGHRSLPWASEAEAQLQQALTIARAQQAKSLELRATVHLARLWHRQGKATAARRLLTELYAWFTEGVATADLQEAHTLLATLS